jgi:hypothetical protein
MLREVLPKSRSRSSGTTDGLYGESRSRVTLCCNND